MQIKLPHFVAATAVSGALVFAGVSLASAQTTPTSTPGSSVPTTEGTAPSTPDETTPSTEGTAPSTPDETTPSTEGTDPSTEGTDPGAATEPGAGKRGPRAHDGDENCPDQGSEGSTEGTDEAGTTSAPSRSRTHQRSTGAARSV